MVGGHEVALVGAHRNAFAEFSDDELQPWPEKQKHQSFLRVHSRYKCAVQVQSCVTSHSLWNRATSVKVWHLLLCATYSQFHCISSTLKVS